MKKKLFFLSLLLISIFSPGCKSKATSHSDAGSTYNTSYVLNRVKDRQYPSAFMAWYNIDMPEFSMNTEYDRIVACAKHDLMWEEPLSQLGEGVELVLGLEWDHRYQGLASEFTTESLERATRNKKQLLELNPNMISLFEIRWRDSPMSFLPEDSEWWKRDDEGQIIKGWLGGWEPFYMLDYDNPEFQDNVARQAKISVESGVYDGIMLDWSGHLGIIKKIRKAIGDDKLIIVNIHDDISDGELYKDYINGSFMELNPVDNKSLAVDELKLHNENDVNKRDWRKIEQALLWFENNLQEPQINCLEVWGNRDDIRRMRVTTAMSLVLSDGYVLYADPNPLETPDHLHDWYPMWDIELGKPKNEGVKNKDGYWTREYDNGIVVYNPYDNDQVKVEFTKPHKKASTGEVATQFSIDNIDGDIFIPQPAI